MGHDRWISYVFRYSNGIKCESAGFVKFSPVVHNGEDYVRLRTGLKMYKKKLCNCLVYLIHNDNRAKYLMKICVEAEEKEAVTKNLEIPWKNCLGDGRAIEEYYGMFFVCDDGQVLASSWKDREVDIESIKIEQKTKSVEENIESRVEDKKRDIAKAEEKINPEINIKTTENTTAKIVTEIEEKIKPERIVEAINNEKPEMITETDQRVEQEMIDTYPKLPLFPDSQFIECVKIAPQDLGKLAMGNWKLGVNSFLSHGYYHYKYIMLGKVEFDTRDCYVIGVPGVFTNKEKYLANMFGFTIFIPIKKSSVLTGQFGYWISEVSNV